MKLLLIILAAMHCSAIVAQPGLKKKDAGLIIQGKLTNCPERVLYCYYKSETDDKQEDTLRLDETGNFYLQTHKLNKPAILNIRNNNLQLNGLFVAPGYSLYITGDAPDYLTLFKTKQIKGMGSAVNRYRLLVDSLDLRDSNQLYYKMTESAFIAYIKNKQRCKDSIAQLVFSKIKVQDASCRYFRQMILYDNRFSAANLALSYSRLHGYDEDKTLTLLQFIQPPVISKRISRDEYLVSDEYRSFITGGYLRLLLQSDYKKDSTLKKNRDYALNKILVAYKGNVAKFALNRIISERIFSATTPEQLYTVQGSLDKYESHLPDNAKQKLLYEINDKISYFRRTRIGSQAANFQLEDPEGKIHSLQDFMGKVIYIDLWASWCGPCRQQTPFMKELVEKYSKEERLLVMGIAVSDGKQPWKEAIAKDRTTWLQLIDQDQFIYNYYMAHLIPKFILIDKSGRIVTLDAPAPSQQEDIFKLLDNEINR